MRPGDVAPAPSGGGAPVAPFRGGEQRVGEIHGQGFRRVGHVAPQVEGQRRPVAGEGERVARQVEEAGDARVVGQVPATVVEGEAPHSGPCLQRPHRAKGEARHRTVGVDSVVVPFGHEERLAPEPPVAERVLRHSARPENRVAGAGAQRLLPAPVHPVHKDVLVGMDVAVAVGGVLHLEDGAREQGEVVAREERPDAQFPAQEPLGAAVEAAVQPVPEGVEGGVFLGLRSPGERARRRTLRREARPGARRLLALLVEKPRPQPGEAKFGDGARRLEVLVPETLVLRAERDQRRLVGKRPPRVGVHVRQEEAREVAPVAEAALGRELDGLHRRVAVAVDAQVPPRRATRDVEVGREVDAARNALRDEAVELVERGFVRHQHAVFVAGERTVVVVDADGVVAEAEDALGQRRRLFGRFREVGGLAKVDAAETLRDARQSLELGVVADAPQPAVFSRGGVAGDDAREVERRAGKDVLAVFHRHPAAAVGDNRRAGAREPEGARGAAGRVRRGGKLHREAERVAGPCVRHRTPAERQAPERVIGPAVGIVGEFGVARRGGGPPPRGSRETNAAHPGRAISDDDLAASEIGTRQLQDGQRLGLRGILREREAPLGDGRPPLVGGFQRRDTRRQEALPGGAQFKRHAPVRRRRPFADGDRRHAVHHQARRDGAFHPRKPDRAVALERQGLGPRRRRHGGREKRRNRRELHRSRSSPGTIARR